MAARPAGITLSLNIFTEFAKRPLRMSPLKPGGGILSGALTLRNVFHEPLTLRVSGISDSCNWLGSSMNLPRKKPRSRRISHFRSLSLSISLPGIRKAKESSRFKLNRVRLNRWLPMNSLATETSNSHVDEDNIIPPATSSVCIVEKNLGLRTNDHNGSAGCLTREKERNDLCPSVAGQRECKHVRR